MTDRSFNGIFNNIIGPKCVALKTPINNNHNKKDLKLVYQNNATRIC